MSHQQEIIEQLLQNILSELRFLSAWSKDWDQLPRNEPMMFPEEVCERLRCSRSTLNNYVKKGMPYYKAGNRTYYKWSEILAFMKSTRK
ncbi:MAG: helix-turn-helix domain-containing protein [Bacteroidota bacterium]